MLFLMGQVLVLRDSMAFYSKAISNRLKYHLQGLVQVMTWERVPKDESPTTFWKRFWKMKGDKYNLIVALGPKSLRFASQYVKNHPVLYVENYTHLIDPPQNFAGVYVAIDYRDQLERLLCSVKEAKILGIILHTEDWGTLNRLFYETNPGVFEMHIQFVSSPSQINEVLDDLKSVGVRVIWVPSGSRVSLGRYLRDLLKGAAKRKIAVAGVRISDVRQGALMGWEPEEEEIGDALASLIEDLLERVKGGEEDSTSVDWRSVILKRYIFFVKGKTKGISGFNLEVAKKLKLHINEDCVRRFDETY
ncbi:MAG: hypothetical protein GXO39_00660 [Thermotogae bacterium]|nr:hypothetical protein [Thermotogota bacterium]